MRYELETSETGSRRRRWYVGYCTSKLAKLLLQYRGGTEAVNFVRMQIHTGLAAVFTLPYSL
jgi:hypothetical protein